VRGEEVQELEGYSLLRGVGTRKLKGYKVQKLKMSFEMFSVKRCHPELVEGCCAGNLNFNDQIKIKMSFYPSAKADGKKYNQEIIIAKFLAVPFKGRK
jgi:hypothetical protein